MGVTPRTKHFKQAMHYIRDCVHEKWIKLLHITTDKQLADWFSRDLQWHTAPSESSPCLECLNTIAQRTHYAGSGKP